MNNAKTLGELIKTGYTAKGIKDELRDNLIDKIKKKENIFKGRRFFFFACLACMDCRPAENRFYNTFICMDVHPF